MFKKEKKQNNQFRNDVKLSKYQRKLSCWSKFNSNWRQTEKKMTKKTAVMHKPAIQLIYNQKRIIYAFNPSVQLLILFSLWFFVTYIRFWKVFKERQGRESQTHSVIGIRSSAFKADALPENGTIPHTSRQLLPIYDLLLCDTSLFVLTRL